MLAVEQERYTRERIKFLLTEYQRMAQNARLPKREEVLGTTPGRADEAPDLATHRLKADLEQALQLVPFMWAQVTFMALSVGASDWHHGLVGWQRIIGKTKKHAPSTWYEVVAEWWGLNAEAKDEPQRGAATVRRVVDDTIEAVYRELNGY